MQKIWKLTDRFLVWVLDTIPYVFFPTRMFTKGSERKWVRALGQIGVVIPCLPLTIAGVVLMIVVLMIGGVLWVIFDWWRDV